ncbi:MAG: vWA domain-containing protein [Ardenticatenales bacterium]
MSATRVPLPPRSTPSASPRPVGAWRIALALGAAAALLTALAARDPRPDAATARADTRRPRAQAQVDPGGPVVDRLDGACRTTNPFVAVAVQVRGMNPAANAAAPAIVAVRDTASGYEPERVVLATNGQVGSVDGLAYDPVGHALFAAAYMRRGAAFGPGGPGAVYRIDVASGEVTVWATLNAGADPHAAGLADDPTVDDGAAAASVGKIGLGDIALSGDGSALHIVNLSDRNIYTLKIADGAQIGRFRDRVRRDQFDKALHPFALAASGADVLYAVTDGYDPDYPPRSKAAYVYAAQPDGSNPRTFAFADWSYARTPAWSPWLDKLAMLEANAVDQPYLVGLALRPNGAPVLGWRDRTVDMVPGAVLGAPPNGSSVGDLRATRFQGVTWRTVDTPAFDVVGDGGQDAAFGAVAMIPGLDVVVAPTLALRGTQEVGASGIGLAWYDATSMRRIGTEPVYDLAGATDMAQELAAGDVTVLCAATPAADVDIPGTATAVGAPVASATSAAAQTAAANGRNLTATAAPTVYAATQTAHAPTEIARATDARGTATAMAPTSEAIETRRPAALTAEAATATVASARVATAGPKLAARLVSTPIPTRSTARRDAVILARATIRAADASDNPYLAVANHVPAMDNGGQPQNDAWLAEQPVVIAFNDTEPEDETAHHTLAWHNEMGSVFGVASDIAREQLYVGAYLKRMTAFGPLGPGGIYRIDLATGDVEPFAVLDAGADPHDFTRTFDVSAENFVSRIGLGDLELAPELDELFAVNLMDRLIYRIHVPDGRVMGAFPNGVLTEARPADVTPFGLGWHDGRLYHGVVINGRTPPVAVVFSSLDDGSDMREVARLPLDYPRQPMWADRTAGAQAADPLLVDLEFRNDGDLVIGLRDRLGDTMVGGVGSGDVILTTRVGDRFIPLPAPELYDDTILHPETAFGSLASLPWLDQVLSTAVDPVTVNSNGALWYDNITGAHVRRETVHAGFGDTFAKAAGLGDMESLNVAPTPTNTPTPTDVYTRTPSPSPSVTITPSPTVSPSPTPGHFVIYLPMAQKRHCVPYETRTDVVLVLDMSTSMYRLTRGNRTKHDAAVDAAHTFVGLMRFAADDAGRRDRVGVVGFNNDAWVATTLTSDRPAIDAALDSLASGIKEGTRLDLAIQQGQSLLDATPRAKGVDPVIILLTDGLPNRVPTPVGGGRQEDTVLKASDAAKALGTRIFAIGLGETGDVFESLLGGVATGPGDFFMAPDGEDLAGIYRGIAGRLTGCP